MKQTVGLGVILAVAVAAMRLTTGPATPSQAGDGITPPGKSRSARAKSSVVAPAPTDYMGGCTAYLNEKPRKDAVADEYPKDATAAAAKSVLDTFFALNSKSETSIALHQRPGIRYILALVPDPRHTNLSLMFDRAMVMTQQAAQDEGYTYNSSWLPWKTESSSFPLMQDQQRADDETGHSEACPGVLLFRKSVTHSETGGLPPPAAEAYDKALVVLVVGEQPTGGINEVQWANAIHWLNLNASLTESSPARHDTPRTLRIFGPSFSGSLVALDRDLTQIYASKEAAAFPSHTTPARIFSGGVSSCSLVRWFDERLRNAPYPAADAATTPYPFHPAVAFATFNENDELHIDRFFRYLSQQGTDLKDTAILSEDETAYASGYDPDAGRSTRGPRCDVPYDPDHRPVKLSYPRDISALRSAYEKQSVFSAGQATRAAHPILQENSGLEGELSTASDSIRTFSGALSAVEQEAVLYGIVSHLRAHHTRYLLLRCTNPLDNLFLTRFFHRAFPDARIVTVASDLLFRREIDTTEFRGVLALSSYPLLPRNQHWSHLVAAPGPTSAHTHRLFESNLQGLYIAARYLFDTTQDAALARTASDQPLTLPFKADLPEYADPFWLHTPQALGGSIHPPTWLAAVGRDGYWPVAVLNDNSTPRVSLEVSEKNGSPIPVPFNLATRPPSTMVGLRQATSSPNEHSNECHYERQPADPSRFASFLLLHLPFPWQVCILSVLLLLGYQLFGIVGGDRRTASGFFASFRIVATPAQSILMGINSAFAVALLFELVSPALTLFTGTSSSAVSRFPLACFAIALLIIALSCLAFYRGSHKDGGAALTFVAAFLLLAITSELVLGASLNDADSIPLFYRMGQLTSGVSPLVPILFVLVGFYLWTWQALAGNALLCEGHPLLPRLEHRTPHAAHPNPARGRMIPALRRGYDRVLSVEPTEVQAELSDDQAGPPNQNHPTSPHRLPHRFFRISHELDKSILRIASPLCVAPQITLGPLAILAAALCFFFFDHQLPLLGLESHAFTVAVNFALLSAFLLTIAEALRLYNTWVHLRFLLTALNRLPLRRTFAKLRPVDFNSLWSVSGSVQRIQYLFLTHQLDAARRLSHLPHGRRISLINAIASGEAFALRTADQLEAGARWEVPVRRHTNPHQRDSPQVKVLVREELNDAVADIFRHLLLPHWEKEKVSLCLVTTPTSTDTAAEHGKEAHAACDLPLGSTDTIQAAEEFVCLHYIAFIQNILARMRTMILSMIFLFVSVCLAISFYPFVPRTGIGMWMMINLALIAASVIFVYAGMERDATLSYITNTRPGVLGTEFYIKTATFLAGPVLGLLTTQFPAISESILGILQPGLDALK